MVNTSFEYQDPGTIIHSNQTRSCHWTSRYTNPITIDSLLIVKAVMRGWNMIHHGACFVQMYRNMMTSSNENIFRVAGPLCGAFTGHRSIARLCREFTGHRSIPRKRPVTRSFDVFLICARIKGWVNTREAGDLRRHRPHYDVTIMVLKHAMSIRDIGIIAALVDAITAHYKNLKYGYAFNQATHGAGLITRL